MTDAKRLIGRKFDDPIVQDDMKQWPFKVVADTNNKPVIVVTYKDEEKKFSPEELSSMILVRMKDIAETYLGKELKDAVVTVPAYFNDSQRKATKDAVVIAGLNVLRIINEPTAAAIAYGLDKELIGNNNEVTKNILVFDLGGGTFDVSLVAVQMNAFVVKAVNGDTHLGGADFDTRLVNYLVAEFERKHKKKLGDNPRALGRLRGECERAKRNLSWSTESLIEIDCLCDGIDFRTTVTRARFEKINHDLFKKCLGPVKQCLEDAKMEKNDVDDIVLVGGSTRIPMVQQLLQDYFDGKQLCRSINPDEAVAYGAASYAAILAGVGDLKDTVLVDVTPLSLGLEVYDTSMNVIVPRNTIIPTKMLGKLQTAVDNQLSVPFEVYEGERYIAKENNFLGKFVLYDLPPGPKGSAKFDVWFEIDANGILTVSAKLDGTCNEDQITITEHSGRLSKDEIDRMVNEGKMYRAHEEIFRKAIKAKTALENYIEEVRSTVRRYLDRVNEEDIKAVEDAIELTIEWLDWNYLCGDPTVFEQKMVELESVFDDVLEKKGKIGVTKLNEVD